MTSLLDIQHKLRNATAALGKLEGQLTHHPTSSALQSNILSLRKLSRNLETDFQQAADLAGLDVCRYRLLEDHPTARAFAKAIGNFQDAFSLAYDAIRNGPKDRRSLSSDVSQRTELRLAYTFPGSFGVVFTIPNSRLMFEAPTYLDEAADMVFSLARAKTDGELVRGVARQIGRAPIAAFYDWAKGNSQTGTGAQIEWLRKSAVTNEVMIQPPEFKALSEIIESTSEQTVTTEDLIGVLVGADIKSRRFHFIADDADNSIRGRFTDAISENQQARLPQRYVATVQKTSEVRYATEKEDVSYFLQRLQPAT